MEAFAFPLYILVKAGAYMGWCGLGARIHGHTDRIARKAAGYGFLRWILGAVLGMVAIFFLIQLIATEIRNPVVIYLAVYIPVRWIEWSLMAVLMDTKDRSLGQFLYGRTAKSRLWRAGGIVISCLADIPLMIAAGGLPIGRFMC